MDKDKHAVDKSKPMGDASKLLKKKGMHIPKSAKEVPLDAEEIVNGKFLGMLFGAIVVIVVASYINSLWGQLVFNDGQTLRFLSAVQDNNAFWSQLWAQAFSSPLSQQWLKATYAWDFQAAGVNIVWHHVVNIGLHLVASCYLFALLFRMCWRLKQQGRLDVDPYMLSFAAAAIFACHPLTAEGVAYISGRVAPLLAANYFLALNCFLTAYLAKGKTLKFWGYLLAFAFVANAILVAPESLTLPLTMIVIAALLKKPHIGWLNWASERGFVLAALVLALGTLPYLALRGVNILAGNGAGLEMLSPVSYYATQMKSLVTYYLRCFIVPIGLTVDPPYVVANDFADPLAILGIVVILAALAGIWLLRTRPMLSFGLYMFLIGLVPGVLIIQPEFVADKRFYLSVAGLAIIAGWGLAKLAVVSWKKTLIVTSAVLLAFVGLTMWRNYTFSSNETLWKAALQANPDSARAHAMHALVLTQQGKSEKAAIEAKQALKLNPRICPAFLAVGGVLLHEKDYQGARDAFANALEMAEKQKLSPEIIGTAASGLAESYMNLGKGQEALPFIQKAEESDPDNPRVHYIAGNCMLQARQFHLAYFELQNAVKQDPSLIDAYEPLSKAAIAMGAGDDAFKAAQVAGQVDKTGRGQIAVPRVLIWAGQYDKAISMLEEVLKKDEKNAQALALLSFAEGQSGLHAKAAEHKKAALALDADVFTKAYLPPAKQ